MNIKILHHNFRMLIQQRQSIRPLALVIFLTLPGLATGTSAITEIQAEAVRFLTELHESSKGKAEITVARLDSGLQVHSCGEPLVGFLPPNGRTAGNITVGVRCPGPKAWQVYTSARVSIARDVVVAARRLERGSEITPQLVTWSQRDVGTLYRGYLDDPKQFEGMRLKRAVPMGNVINPSMLEAKPLVQRGDRVTLVVSAGGMEVSAVGEMLNEAAAGQLVRARNLSSKRVVQGHLQADRTIRVVR